MEFDFNELDDYKKAIDVGFQFGEFISPIEFLKIGKFEEEYNMELKDCLSLEKYKESDLDWEELKKKVASFFLEVEEDEV
ncbi:MAG: hypothetical protein ACRCXX_07165 [Cetobacterium sp.]|uniref:hypothetical protein n=1 Tax=Cetobacterium sp. TaxID=2071632 RepID=UPI003F4186F5